jgi:hypothetical protein
MVQGAQQITPIGRGRIDRWFWGNVDQGNLHPLQLGHRSGQRALHDEFSHRARAAPRRKS